ncbi:MAG: mevalonate kinase [Candidatus Kariarchaeaceae archaeon]
MNNKTIPRLVSMGYGSAPGKVILAGEHSVVHGTAAIAASLGLRCSVEAEEGDVGIAIEAVDIDETFHYSIEDLKQLSNNSTVHERLDSIALSGLKALTKESPRLQLKISSQIPISAGLGSSAAVAVATVAAVWDLYGYPMSLPKISQIAYESEKITHGTPSGIDNSIATYGGILMFKQGEITTSGLKQNIPLLIGNTLVHRDTKKIVSKVSSLKNSYPSLVEPIIASMDALGVNHPALSKLIWTARDAGALGAKLTGAGGGGCMIALASSTKALHVIAQQLQRDFQIIPTELSPVGVRVGKSGSTGEF